MVNNPVSEVEIPVNVYIVYCIYKRLWGRGATLCSRDIFATRKVIFLSLFQVIKVLIFEKNTQEFSFRIQRCNQVKNSVFTKKTALMFSVFSPSFNHD